VITRPRQQKKKPSYTTVHAHLTKFAPINSHFLRSEDACPVGYTAPRWSLRSLRPINLCLY